MNSIIAKAQAIVRAAPSDVFDAFVDAQTTSKFWFTRRDTGLEVGKTVHWYVGTEKDAYAIEVRVKELVKPESILIEWWGSDQFTEVLWQIVETEDGNTRLTIEESGFEGTTDEIVSNGLDSTGGFNQVIIALKALLEHQAVINVVADHA
ncbi:MAG: SRPBCC domain-containing protein [Pseudomonadota bacterium]